MPRFIPSATRIPTPGGKVIDEYVGRVSTSTDKVSVAHMVSPGAWQEPAQAPEFDEISVVLRGRLRVEHDGGALDVGAGQAILCAAGERVRYSTPEPEGAEYVAICLPAFADQLAHREG
jgi:mannose-6-phosphate isomerase-like protein (cupin superfamily)